MLRDAVIDRPCQEPVPGLERLARRPGPWFALAWLPILLAGPLIQAALDADPVRLLALVVFGGAFAGTVLLPFHVRERGWSELAFTGLVLLFVAYFAIWRLDTVFLHPLMAIGAAIAVRQRWALGIVVGLTVSGASAHGVEQGSLEDGMLLGFATLMAGATSFLVQHLIELAHRLHRLQDRLARSAVAEERLRFSRDLHDLLGHTLSVIVVKAEAARRLAERDPRAAASHAREIETVGRHALTEVRQVVSGYRSAGLAEAIESARQALAPRGTALHATVPDGELDEETDALLGWIVREGATNVLRHARGATACHVRVSRADGVVRVELRDDGASAHDPSALDAAATGRKRPAGSGLAGLQERVDRAGGVLTAGATPDGWRVVATIPADPPPTRRGPTHPEPAS